MTELVDLECGCMEVYYDRIYHHTMHPFTCLEGHTYAAPSALEAPPRGADKLRTGSSPITTQLELF